MSTLSEELTIYEGHDSHGPKPPYYQVRRLSPEEIPTPTPIWSIRDLQLLLQATYPYVQVLKPRTIQAGDRLL